MTTGSITPFEHTMQVSNEWLNQLNQEVGRDDRQQAYRMLRAVLIALRDRLTVEEATDLGAQLPMLIRGIYYEAYDPSKTPTLERNRQAFLDRVSENLQAGADGDPEEVVRAVFRLLAHRVTAGEISDVRANLPKDIQDLWE